jgi:hypothetical protein
VVKDRHKYWPGIFIKGIGRKKKTQKSASSRKNPRSKTK